MFPAPKESYDDAIALLSTGLAIATSVRDISLIGHIGDSNDISCAANIVALFRLLPVLQSARLVSLPWSHSPDDFEPRLGILGAISELEFVRISYQGEGTCCDMLQFFTSVRNLTFSGCELGVAYRFPTMAPIHCDELLIDSSEVHAAIPIANIRKLGLIDRAAGSAAVVAETIQRGSLETLTEFRLVAGPVDAGAYSRARHWYTGLTHADTDAVRARLESLLPVIPQCRSLSVLQLSPSFGIQIDDRATIRRTGDWATSVLVAMPLSVQCVVIMLGGTCDMFDNMARPVLVQQIHWPDIASHWKAHRASRPPRIIVIRSVLDESGNVVGSHRWSLLHEVFIRYGFRDYQGDWCKPLSLLIRCC